MIFTWSQKGSIASMGNPPQMKEPNNIQRNANTITTRHQTFSPHVRYAWQEKKLISSRKLLEQENKMREKIAHGFSFFSASFYPEL